MEKGTNRLELSPEAKKILERYVEKKCCSIINSAEKLALKADKSRVNENDMLRAILLTEKTTSKRQLIWICLLFLALVSVCILLAFGIFYMLYRQFPSELHGATITVGGITAAAGLCVLVARETPKN